MKTKRNRERRVILQEDANMPFELLGTDIDGWIGFRFDLMDSAENQVDAVMWDLGLAEDSFATWTGSGFLPPVNYRGFNRWFEAGIDCVERLVEETHKRGLEAIWNHRVCPVDFPVPYNADCPYSSSLRNNYLKKQHPDWINECWWPHGLWNLASKGLREHKKKYFYELMTRYDFDGLELDFARHTPCLPPGREWDNRSHATDFVRETRDLLIGMESRRGKTLSLGARVAENIAGCHADGFEIERWIEEGLLDFILAGGRTSTVAVEEFKALCGNRDIKIYPSFDGFHAGDGYFCPPPAYLRGVFSNFLRQGADGISLFNWACARREKYRELKIPRKALCSSLEEIFPECGSLAAMEKGDKMYAAERRGGYPWAGNYLYRNDDKPLPCAIDAGAPAVVPVYIYERFTAGSRGVLDLILLGAGRETILSAKVNGNSLGPAGKDFNTRDGQVYGKGKQPDSGDYRAYGAASGLKLARFSAEIPLNLLACGENKVEVELLKAGKKQVTLEKIEITACHSVPGSEWPEGGKRRDG